MITRIHLNAAEMLPPGDLLVCSESQKLVRNGFKLVFQDVGTLSAELRFMQPTDKL